ncbi:hypothetical protein AAHE18_13G181400 [Arachis hypogaea]
MYQIQVLLSVISKFSKARHPVMLPKFDMIPIVNAPNDIILYILLGQANSSPEIQITPLPSHFGDDITPAVVFKAENSSTKKVFLLYIPTYFHHEGMVDFLSILDCQSSKLLGFSDILPNQ